MEVYRADTIQTGDAALVIDSLACMMPTRGRLAADATVTLAVRSLPAVATASDAPLPYAEALVESALADASAAAAFSAAAVASSESPGLLCSCSLKGLSVEVTCPALQKIQAKQG